MRSDSERRWVGFFLSTLLLLPSVGGRAQERSSPALRALREAMERVFAAGEQTQRWKQKAPARYFAGDEIYAYMDGAGEIPKACGFRLLGVADYVHRSGVTATVELYDMGSDANAFGLYSMKRRPNHRFVALTHPASLSQGQVVFWKGRYTAILFTDQPQRLPEQALLELGRSLERSIRPAGHLPDLLRYLPRRGYVKHSAKYFHTKFALDTVWFHQDNVFQLKQRTEVVAAEYRNPKGRLLILRYPTPQEALRALAVWRKTFGATRRLELPSPLVGFLARHRKQNMGIVLAKRLLGVVLEAATPTDAEQRLRELARHFQKPPAPWKPAED